MVLAQKKLSSTADNSLTEASTDDVAKWNAMAGPIIDDVLAEANAAGIDAAAAYTFITETMNSY